MAILFHLATAVAFSMLIKMLKKFIEMGIMLNFQTSFQAASKKLNGDHKNETQAIADLATLLKTTSPEAADKISELQKLDR
jgi:hypothetical protein